MSEARRPDPPAAAVADVLRSIGVDLDADRAQSLVERLRGHRDGLAALERRISRETEPPVLRIPPGR